MSGQWEIVGKKKEKGSKDPNPKITQQINKKKPENLNVKVEDVLAKSQVKNLYSNGKNKENKPLEIKKAQEPSSKKTQKKQEKSQEVPKPKPPKSIESALNQIDADEFASIFEKSKSHFPEAPIVWLKELAQFLNQKVNIEVQDPVFTTKPQSYPLSVVPPGIKSVIEKVIQDTDKSNIQLFFDISLTSMATDMSKNLPALGHKILLQYIALKEPSLVSENLSKHCVLRTSYQNRPNVGLSILWAVGQAGTNSFQSALNIFQELMLPLVELKNYSRYVIKYLINLITDAKEASLTKEEFLFILDVFFSNKKNFPNDLKQELTAVIPILKSFFLSSGKKDSYKGTVELYLKKVSGAQDLYQQCLCDVIMECFIRDPNCLEHWCKIYAKNVTSSAILLQHMDKNWRTVGGKLKGKMFSDAITQINIANSELMAKKKKDEGLLDANRIAESLVEKMASKKKSRSPFKLLIFTTCLIAGAYIYYDIKHQGGWPKSNTYKFLKTSGVCEYTHHFINRVQEGLSAIDGQIEANFPSQRRTVIEFSEPYVELSGNLGRVFYNIYIDVKDSVVARYPIVIQSIESYAPGVIQQSQNAVNTVWSSSLFYFNRSVDYLKNEVFVGQLSPENMQKVVFEAFNTTQNKATEYYQWLYKKVQSTIK